MVNLKISKKKKKIVKNRKLKFSKIQKGSFVTTTEKKIQKKFEKFNSDLSEE